MTMPPPAPPAPGSRLPGDGSKRSAPPRGGVAGYQNEYWTHTVLVHTTPPACKADALMLPFISSNLTKGQPAGSKQSILHVYTVRPSRIPDD